ncbi:hypothetical protein [Sphingomonas hengshuiensis]|uniref:Uncharacterized protein n=1 Tax=Sphingomonas hengshuiensis TaxID=1609977 RepID=A0A7U4J829_9SPHN|nr:hypothetical protein [Sphingomonas hengshuiensis]AJP71995.1 hypothetical protein TS85_09695 [Sphingomonas hengshuiensis]
MIAAFLLRAGPGPAPAAPVDWASWAQVGLLVLAILCAACIVRAATPAPPATSQSKAFARFVRTGVERHSQTIVTLFKDRLQQVPADFTEAQAYIRGLRKELRLPLGFIAQVGKPGFDAWPDLKLYEAFHAWAEPIHYTDGLLQDMLADLIAASNKALVGPLLEQFRRNEWSIRVDLLDFETRRAAVVKAAKAIEEPGDKAKGSAHAAHG